MNIPARYATGYLGDIGVPPVPDPMDFSAWFEAYLGGHWHTFDARHNRRRIGRVLIGRGRDAGDVPITQWCLANICLKTLASSRKRSLPNSDTPVSLFA
jgi:transglutaminase-like putative cysteine protease